MWKLQFLLLLQTRDIHVDLENMGRKVNEFIWIPGRASHSRLTPTQRWQKPQTGREATADVSASGMDAPQVSHSSRGAWRLKLISMSPRTTLAMYPYKAKEANLNKEGSQFADTPPRISFERRTHCDNYAVASNLIMCSSEACGEGQMRWGDISTLKRDEINDIPFISASIHLTPPLPNQLHISEWQHRRWGGQSVIKSSIYHFVTFMSSARMWSIIYV